MLSCRFFIYLKIRFLLTPVFLFGILLTVHKWALYFPYIMIPKPVCFPFCVSVSVLKEESVRKLNYASITKADAYAMAFK